MSRIPCDGMVLVDGKIEPCPNNADPGCGVAFQNLCGSHSLPPALATREPAMTDRISIPQLREYLDDKEKHEDDISVLDTDECRALLDAVEVAHQFRVEFDRDAREQTGAAWDGPDVNGLFAALARFDFGDPA